MENYLVLDFGMRIDEATSPVQLTHVIRELEESPTNEDRERLLSAARLKMAERSVFCSDEDKARLFELAKRWFRLDDRAARNRKRNRYQEFLLGDMDLAEVGSGRRATDFHAALVEFAGTDDAKALIYALFRVREATRQYLDSKVAKYSAAQTPIEEWSPHHPLRTVWASDAN